MFRFTIRDLLWLAVLAAAVVVGWQNFVARGRLERQVRDLQEENAGLEVKMSRYRWHIDAYQVPEVTMFDNPEPSDLSTKMRRDAVQQKLQH